MPAKLEDDGELVRLLSALADPSRLRIIDLLAAEGRRSVADLCARLPVSRFAVMKRLKVLEATGIVSREAIGRMRLAALRTEWPDRIAVWLRRLP